MRIVALVLASILMLLIIVGCLEFSAGMNRGLHGGLRLRTCAVVTVCHWQPSASHAGSEVARK